jgi:hypothetical protein
VAVRFDFRVCPHFGGEAFSRLIFRGCGAGVTGMYWRLTLPKPAEMFRPVFKEKETGCNENAFCEPPTRTAAPMPAPAETDR